ncbi:hypothetical protein BJV82DRAFT_516230 [Fennellomyces sp. T-0311]|nr:hypothetical protein BJV82DRAFT_516230 [Fennellomyces sp. T-0311]
MSNGPTSSLASAALSSDISPQDQALIMFHLQYNPALERMYELPPWGNQSAEHYVGDKGLILALSYVHNTNSEQALPSYYAYPSSNTSASPPHLKAHWLRVTLGWIVSGMEPEIVPTQIYPQRYARLGHALARHGFFKYDPLSEPVLSHIVHLEDDQLTPPPLATATQQPSHFPTCHTRLSRLQHMLEGAGVDARVLWKYTFAKSYVIGNGSLLGEEDVVRRIQDSEDEWRVKRISLARRLGIAA